MTDQKPREILREQIRMAMPPVQCESCYLHRPLTFTKKDCVTYGKRACAYENIYIDNLIKIFEE
jgi:hypothetical protein